MSKFSLYVRDLLTFCRTRTVVGQGLLEMAVKDALMVNGDGGLVEDSRGHSWC